MAEDNDTPPPLTGGQNVPEDADFMSIPTIPEGLDPDLHPVIEYLVGIIRRETEMARERQEQNRNTELVETIRRETEMAIERRQEQTRNTLTHDQIKVLEQALEPLGIEPPSWNTASSSHPQMSLAHPDEPWSRGEIGDLVETCLNRGPDTKSVYTYRRADAGEVKTEVIKVGPHVHQREFDNLEALRNLGLPVPEAIRFESVKIYPHRGLPPVASTQPPPSNYIRMTWIDGKSLRDAWPLMQEDEKFTMVNQIASFMQALQLATARIPRSQGNPTIGPFCFGLGSSTPAQSEIQTMMKHEIDPGRMSNPPLKSGKSMGVSHFLGFCPWSPVRNYLDFVFKMGGWLCTLWDRTQHPPGRGREVARRVQYILYSFRPIQERTQPVATHGDFKLGNFLTKGRELVGVTGWGFAEFGPEYWELERMLANVYGFKALSPDVNFAVHVLIVARNVDWRALWAMAYVRRTFAGGQIIDVLPENVLHLEPIELQGRLINSQLEAKTPEVRLKRMIAHAKLLESTGQESHGLVERELVRALLCIVELYTCNEFVDFDELDETESDSSEESGPGEASEATGKGKGKQEKEEEEKDKGEESENKQDKPAQQSST